MKDRDSIPGEGGGLVPAGGANPEHEQREAKAREEFTDSLLRQISYICRVSAQDGLSDQLPRELRVTAG